MGDIAANIESFLQKHEVNYDVLTHARTDSLAEAATLVHIPASMIARAVMLGSDNGASLVTVLPLNHMLDFQALEKYTGKAWTPIPAARSNSVFHDCEAGTVPVLANAYNIHAIYDKSLLQCEIVVFEGGRHCTLVRLRQEDFRKLIREDQLADIAQPEQILKQRIEAGIPGTTQESYSRDLNLGSLTPGEVARNAINRIYELPVLPRHVQQILALRDNPKATPRQLADLVEQDPSLAAQVMRYAHSPYFAISEQVRDIRDAITLALGFDMVMNLALGIAAFGTFKTPADGPLGLKALGRHSVLSAMLAKQLVQKYQLVKGVSAGEAYLAGLLHNLGYLLYSHLFQPEFYLLNRMVQANPHLPVTLVEKRVLVPGHAHEMMQMGHAQAGSMLLEHWDLPLHILVACREHHNPDYQGPHYLLANLLCLVDCLLMGHGIGDAENVEIPGKILENLNLSGNLLEEIQQELALMIEHGREMELMLTA